MVWLLFIGDGAWLLSMSFPEEHVDVRSCAEQGVLSSLPALLGAMQTNLALLCLLGQGAAWQGKLWHCDVRRAV